MGGGNSAGQAAVFLAGHARQVLLLIRGDDLHKNMSSYLVRRIEQTANIELLCNTTVRRMHGDGHLELGRDRQQQDRARSGRWRRRRCSASSGRCRGPTGCPRRSRGTPRGSSGPGRRWRSRRYWTAPAAAVPAGDQPARGVRRRRRAVRLGQARRLGRRRGRDGGPVRARVPQGDVIKHLGADVQGGLTYLEHVVRQTLA